jgi:hypothetical protein
MSYCPPTLEESGSVSIAGLKDKHAGQMAYVVGKGPSLHHLRAEDFGPGPVIVLNEAIATVQVLGLPNVIYAMQKDGCVTADQDTIPRPCGTCEAFGWQRPPVINPFPGINVVFSQYLSSWCLHGRNRRYVFTDAELGYPDAPFTMSVLEAIPFAQHLGASAITMVCCDHLVTGDSGYAVDAGSDAALQRAQSNLEWVKPRVLAALKAFGPHAFYVPTP